MSGRTGLTLEGLVKEAGAVASTRDQVISIVGEAAVPFLDTFEKTAADRGEDLYANYDVASLAGITRTAMQRAQEKIAQAHLNNGEHGSSPHRSSDMTVVSPNQAGGVKVASPNDRMVKLAADDEAMAHAYGEAMGRAQAQGFYDEMQKLASASEEEGLFKLAHLDEETLDTLASHHANDLLAFTGRVAPEKVAQAEGLDEEREAVFSLPLAGEVFHELGNRAYEKLASQWGQDEADSIMVDIVQAIQELEAEGY